MKYISEACKTNVWKTRVTQILTLQDKICDAIKHDVELYLKIQDHFIRKECDSEDFENLFFELYKFPFWSHKKIDHRLVDMKLFHALLSEEQNLSIGEAAKKLRPEYPNFDLASKIKHTINNDLPIMDFCLNKFFNQPDPVIMVMTVNKKWKGPLFTSEERFQRQMKDYCSLIQWYGDHINRELEPLRETFESHFPDVKISAVKKIDFMIHGGFKLDLYNTEISVL